MGMKKNTVADFWNRVAKGDACWIWQGRCNADGYGEFKMEYKTHLAHRLAYELKYGPIPPDMCICHTCDNPACANPAHLFAGSHADNVRDRDAKGHTARLAGEQNPNAKLTARDVILIRQLHQTGRSKGSMARQFGVSHRGITQVITGERWGWLR
jgi:hypothetical protein